MGKLIFPNGAEYVTGTARPAAKGGAPVSKAAVSKAIEARVERIMKARRYRRLAERTADRELREHFSRVAKELEDELEKQ